MRDHVRKETALLLRRFQSQLRKAGKSCDAEAVHDLRVSVRRLSRCLRVFADFYPDNSGKKIRRRLKELMTAAGGVRDLDIALELVGKSEVKDAGGLIYTLAGAHNKARRELERTVIQWNELDMTKKWKSSLGLAA